MTGRRAGYCVGYDAPGYANAMPGRGLGMGWGRGRGRGGGRGWRNMYYATGLPGWARYGPAPGWGPPPGAAYGPYGAAPTPEQETEFLKSPAVMLKEEVDDEDIAEVLSRWTGIPVRKMLEGEREKLIQMENRLSMRVIGQKEAITAVSNAVRRARSGLQDPNRPIAQGIKELAENVIERFKEAEEELEEEADEAGLRLGRLFR